MVLSLISPVGGDFIKDFPGQNGINLDRIDSYAGQCALGSALPSWTPVLSATTTAPTLGATGTIKGNYYTIFDQVYVWAEFRFATGFSAGSGTFTMTLPFEMDSTIVPNGTSMGSWNVIGNGFVWDNDTVGGRQPLVVVPRTSTLVHFGNHINLASGGRAVDQTGPITWAVGDGITWSGRYKRLSL